MRLWITALLVLVTVTDSWAQLHAAVLPSSRSVQVGQPATAFSTIINVGTIAAVECSIAPAQTLPATFSYQTTNPATNVPTGTPNTPVNISAGGSQSFIIAFTPTAPIPSTDVLLVFDCLDTDSAPVISRLNTLRLSASSGPIPDIIAIAATLTHDGIVAAPGAFSVAARNIGAAASCTGIMEDICSCWGFGFSVEVSGGAAAAVVCRTNPSTGQCIGETRSAVDVTLAPGQTVTLSVFTSAGNQPIEFDPATNRINVTFRQFANVLFPKPPTGGCYGDIPGVPGRLFLGERGSTSVAVRTGE